MRPTILFFLACCCFIACTSKQQPKLPPAKMQQVLMDVHLAEVYSIMIRKDSLHRGNERNHDTLASFYKTVLKHHNISLEDFRQSINRNKLHPEEMDSIYGRMIPEMSTLDALYN